MNQIQLLDNNILTPNGWIKISDLKIGDVVSSPNKEYNKIDIISPLIEKDIYKITFSDATFTECSIDQLWLTQTSLERNRHAAGKIRNIEQIKNSLLYSNKKNHSIPITKPIEMTEKKLVLNAYAFGCLLGDGTFRNQLGISSADQFILDKIKLSLNEINLTLKSTIDKYSYRIIGLQKIKNYHNIIQNKTSKQYKDINEAASKSDCSVNSIYKSIKKCNPLWSYGNKTTTSSLLNYLRNNNLWMKHSKDKYIPDDYKFNSIENRIELLQGLMDTDGCIANKDGTCF